MEKRNSRKRKEKLFAKFSENIFIEGIFYKKGLHRITEEQKDIIQNTGSYSKGKIMLT